MTVFELLAAATWARRVPASFRPIGRLHNSRTKLEFLSGDLFLLLSYVNVWRAGFLPAGNRFGRVRRCPVKTPNFPGPSERWRGP